MIIVSHRVNTIEKLKQTPRECGVEIDIRPYKDKLVLHHDPFIEGTDFEEFLKNYNHSLLILDVKAEGVEKEVLALVRKYQIKNYFLLGVTPPFIVKLIKESEHAIAVRFSEFESMETCLNFAGKVDWIFIDNFSRLPIENDSFKILRKQFKLCIVSPELLHRDEIQETKKILENNPVDAVLTNNIQGWRGI